MLYSQSDNSSNDVKEKKKAAKKWNICEWKMITNDHNNIWHSFATCWQQKNMFCESNFSDFWLFILYLLYIVSAYSNSYLFGTHTLHLTYILQPFFIYI